MRKLTVTLLSATVLAGAAYYSTQCSEAMMPEKPEYCLKRMVVLSSPDGNDVLRIQAEQAVTQGQKEKGLMYRKEMPFDSGMIFHWPKPQPIYMWMKNTFIPLDMVFALNGTVTGVVEASKTESEDVLTVQGKTDTVLEVNLGVATSKGVTKGWTIKSTNCIPVSPEEQKKMRSY